MSKTPVQEGKNEDSDEDIDDLKEENARLTLENEKLKQRCNQLAGALD